MSTPTTPPPGTTPNANPSHDSPGSPSVTGPRADRASDDRASRAGGAASAEPPPAVIELDTTPSRPVNEAEAAGRVGAADGTAAAAPTEDEPSLTDKVKALLIGKPRDLADQSVFHHLSLVAFLAWVGLGADGLSSSCYGPEEAFKNLIHPTHGDHTYLAFFLALATIATVLVISKCYSHIIEEFPTGGGGYLVASKLLGRPAGVVAGCALLVDYVLTVTVSIAAAGDALFGLMRSLTDRDLSAWKLPAEFVAIGVLVILNLRGVKESVKVLLPIFVLFLVTHAALIFGVVLFNIGEVGHAAGRVADGVREGLAKPGFGFVGMLLLFLRAYSFGAGTYTGIEAVSNSMSVMREPRVATGKRTMLYMAISLAVTAGGLVVGYLLLDVQHTKGKTLNQVFIEAFLENRGLADHWLGAGFLLAAMVSEGALLIVAAQAGFIGGPAALATMARDSWVPHNFANLSERLATHRGVMLIGVAALAALYYTGGNVTALVIMYSINVFVTFSLSMIGMCRLWWARRGDNPLWRRRLAVFALGAVVCLGILGVNVVAKFWEGGWRTISVTLVCVCLCWLINRYYATVAASLRRLDEQLQLPDIGKPNLSAPDPKQPTAAILVGGYGGLGIHTVLNTNRLMPYYFKNMIFLSVGVVDSGNFKGAQALEDLRRHTEESLEKFVNLARRKLGMPSVGFMAIGPDAVDELEQLCVAVAQRFPRAIFFAGQLVFQKDTWYQRWLHNETAWSLQRRLQWTGLPMVILPTRVR